jgi:N utilization substance protein B
MSDGPGSRWEGRRRAREAALRILYETEIGGLAVADAARVHGIIGDADAIQLDDEADDYATRLAVGVWEGRAALDAYISDAALNWRVERIAVIDRIILRLALQELLHEPATPPRVAIDEAIELARLYSGDDAARFVNGVVDGLYRRLKEEGKVIE